MTMAPPAPPAPALPDQTPPRSGATARVMAILTIVLGAVLVLGTAFSAVVSTIASAAVRTETRGLADAAFSSLDLDLASGSLDVSFVDGLSGPELQVTSATGADGWTFAADAGVLSVASPNRLFGPGWLFGGASRAVLRLPAEAQGGSLDVRAEASAGELTLGGDFGDLAITLGAGSAVASGSAQSLTVDVSAGHSEIDLADVGTAAFTVSAGAIDAQLTGRQPQRVDVEVSAGSLDLSVPQGAYDVRSDVAAGDFENGVGTTPGADSDVTVRVSAGSVTLRAG